MRIISGIKKGKKLIIPDQNITRPLRDSVKENIFNILKHSKNFRIEFDNIKVIDFFSGSGSFGIECISRGASHVKFYENHPQTSNVLFRNLSNNFDKKKFDIIKKNFFSVDKIYLIKKFNPNLIFIDPPYEISEFKKILNFINLLPSFKNMIIILHVKKTKIIDLQNFKFIQEKIYGQSKIFFMKTIS